MYIQKSFKDNKNPFYIIPTPIGNLEDITIRSLNVLKDLDTLYCEDKRVTQKLLNHFDLKINLKIYNDHSSLEVLNEILDSVRAGKVMGLVSDAGMPGISDPGFEIIKFLKENDENIVVLPGACAFVEPIVFFAKDNNPFVFHGFLPKNKKAFKLALKEICEENKNSVIYETPHRIESTLSYINELALSNEVLIAREISKIYESYIQGSSKELLDYVLEHPLKGEIAVVIGKPEVYEEIDYMKKIEEKIDLGYSLKDATKEVSLETGISKNLMYKEYLNKEKS